jgi:hypothetical protein
MSGAGEGEPKAKKDGKKPLMKPRPTEGCWAAASDDDI